MKFIKGVLIALAWVVFLLVFIPMLTISNAP
jgi:hypothetical protein